MLWMDIVKQLENIMKTVKTSKRYPGKELKKYILPILSEGQMLSFIYIWKSGAVNLVRIYFLK